MKKYLLAAGSALLVLLARSTLAKLRYKMHPGMMSYGTLNVLNVALMSFVFAVVFWLAKKKRIVFFIYIL